MLRTDIIQKAIISSGSGKILLLRRSETDVRRPLQWDFPGGLLEDGESLEDGVIREIKEEAGLTVSDVKLFFTKAEVSRWKDHSGENESNVVRQYYFTRSDSEQVKISYEHSEFCWASMEEALDLLEYDKHKEVISYIIDNQLEL